MILYFSDDANDIVKTKTNDEFLVKCLLKIVAPIRKLMTDTGIIFDDSFQKNCQEESWLLLPQAFFTFISRMDPK